MYMGGIQKIIEEEVGMGKGESKTHTQVKGEGERSED